LVASGTAMEESQVAQLVRVKDDIVELERLMHLVLVLPMQLKVETMVPLGSLAFVPATLERTNEILVDLGGSTYAWRSAHQAYQFLQRRRAKRETEARAIEQDLVKQGHVSQERQQQQQHQQPPQQKETGGVRFADSTQHDSENIESPEQDLPREIRMTLEEANELYASLPKTKTEKKPISKEEHQKLQDIFESLALQEAEAEENSGNMLEKGEEGEAVAQDKSDEHLTKEADLTDLADMVEELAKPQQPKSVLKSPGKYEARPYDTPEPSVAKTEDKATKSATPVLGSVVERSGAMAKPAPTMEAMPLATSAPRKVSKFKQRMMAQASQDETS